MRQPPHPSRRPLRTAVAVALVGLALALAACSKPPPSAAETVEKERLAVHDAFQANREQALPVYRARWRDAFAPGNSRRPNDRVLLAMAMWLVEDDPDNSAEYVRFAIPFANSSDPGLSSDGLYVLTSASDRESLAVLAAHLDDPREGMSAFVQSALGYRRDQHRGSADAARVRAVISGWCATAAHQAANLCR